MEEKPNANEKPNAKPKHKPNPNAKPKHKPKQNAKHKHTHMARFARQTSLAKPHTPNLTH